jgi:hypothetical protein
MTLSLYDITVPVFIRGFGILSKNLGIARAYADENRIAHDELTTARLYPDMLPLTGQVQRASDTAKFVPVRVAGLQAPAMAFLESVPADAFAGRDGIEVTLKIGQTVLNFTARDYVLGFAIPNYYFHLTTAYAILRHKGVPLGKLDFLGG